ncbi:MAG: porphobilinogen synthase [Deltaproteobacteria bacterium]|nr:porphobilinogen synthase [Deltaproteobacteria bacterium]
MPQFPIARPRRLRENATLRKMLQETRLSLQDLIYPLFIVEGRSKKEVGSMPGVFQLSLGDLEKEIAEIVSLKIPALLLFGLPASKDNLGSSAYAQNNIVCEAIRKIKLLAPKLLLISDICLCEYTEHGHCGLVESRGNSQIIHNDKSLEWLAQMALVHAQAGADLIAPSDMMDGRVAAIRKILDANDFAHIPILSYAVKYASAFYGPFRDAAESAPQFGDRASYQMDPANSREALREAALDIEEGADILMVKPGLPYLDIVKKLKDEFHVPLAVYQVSGEYSMIRAAAEKGWIDEKKLVLESLLSMKRAGADLIITYFAKQVAAWFKEQL